MKARRLVIVAFALLWAWVGTGTAEEVEVIVDSARVKVGQETIGSVKRGDRLTVIRRQGSWVAVRVKSAGGERRGWVLADQVKGVLEPGMGDASPAPAAPKLIEALVSGTQMLLGNPAVLCFELSLTNEGREPVSFDVAKVELTTDNEKLRSVWRPGSSPPPAYMPVAVPAADGRLLHLSPGQLKRLEAGTIAGGGTVSGWMAYEVPERLRGRLLTPRQVRPPEAGPTKWMLTVPAGDEVVQLDLRDLEVKALGARIRPSHLDPSVEVLEIGSRVNALNMGNLIEAFASLSAKRRPCVVLLTTKNCVFDYAARSRLGSSMLPGGYQPSSFVWANVSDEMRYGMSFAYGGMPMRSNLPEASAVLDILAQRSDAADVLPKHLTNPSAETRAAAARLLGRHRDRPGIIDALAKAAADEAPLVRTAAVQSLGGTAWAPVTGSLPYRAAAPQPTLAPPRTQARLDGKVLELLLKALEDPVGSVRSAAVSGLAGSGDPRATKAVVKALTDADAAVRAAAARAAGNHPLDAVVEPLIRLLGPKEPAVAVAACESLGRLKAKAAVSALAQLKAGRDASTAPAAIDALKAIGAMSEVDAALEKLAMGRISTNEFDVLIKTKDPRAVPKLLDAIQIIRDSYYTGQIARALGELGDKRAVEPLIQTLVYSESFQEDVPRALGKLKDGRAIEPLRKALARFSAGDSRRNAVLEGLLMLEAPGILEQLADEIQKNRNSYEANQMLLAMGKYGGNRAIRFIEPSLDDSSSCATAAQALADMGTPEAWAALKNHLAADDYRYAQRVLSQLVQHAGQISEAREAGARRKRVWQVVALVRELHARGNPITRAAATEQMRSLEERLIGEDLRDFQVRVTAGDLDAADEAFQAALDRQWESIAKDPRTVSVLTAYLDRMLTVYAQRGESKRAKDHLEKVLSALQSRAKDAGSEALTQTIFDLRGRKILLGLEQWTAADPEEVRQLLAQLKARIGKKPDLRALSPEMATAATLARVLEFSDQLDLAAEVYRVLAEASGSAPGGSSPHAKEMFEGALRRVQLVGRPMKLQGTRIDGAALQGEAYRGKVLLVEFWATWCHPWRAELPRLRNLYEQYRDRGFDVVGVSLDYDRTALVRSLESEQLPWAVLHDQDSQGRRPLASQYGITEIPVAILADKEGKVVSLRARGEELERLLHRLLGPPRPDAKDVAPPAPPAGPPVPAWAMDIVPVPDVETSRRMESVNKLKQIALGMHSFHNEHRTFPPAYSTLKPRQPLLSWRVHLLPYVGERPLYGQFRLDEPWDSPHNRKLIPLMPRVYQGPGASSGPGETRFLAVRGERTIFPGEKAVGMADIIDGTSNTILIVEAGGVPAVTWTRPDDFLPDAKAPKRGLPGLWQRGFHVAMGDGSVRLLADGIDDKTLEALFTRNGKEPFPDLSAYEVPSTSWPPQIAFGRTTRPSRVAVPDSGQLSAHVRRLGAKPLTKGHRSSWSPDGKRIVFGKHGRGAAGGSRGEGIAILDVETGKIQDLTDAGKDPAWSGKDGRHIAYVTGSGPEEELWLIESSGKNPRRIAEGGYPSWSADGTTLFFQSRRLNKLMSIEFRGDEPSAPKELADVAWWYPAVSADKKRVAYRQGNELVIASLTAEKQQTRYPLSGGQGFLGGWSPDGRRLAFGGWGMSDPVVFQVLDAGSGRAVTIGPQWLTLPAWSPDGSRLSFDVRSSHGFEIWLIETKKLGGRMTPAAK